MKYMNFLKKTAVALVLALVATAGCKKKDWSDEINDLNRRVANLETLSTDLKQKVEAGAMVKSVTQLAGGGWRIEFTGGTTIDVSSASKTDISIGANGNWYIDGADTGNPSRGEDGTAGTIASTLTIGANGNWYLNGTDTGIKAAGKDGAPGKDGSVITIGANGNWYIDGADTGNPSRGEDGTAGTIGSTLTIGANGNWYINGTDTGIKAAGKDGAPGKDGSVITIGANGNWYLNGTDTGMKAAGNAGDSMIAGIVNNDADGTVTITLNDADRTRYTFRKASTAVSFAILNAGRLEIAPGTTGVVRFAVNPSNAYISTNPADWMLADVNTGAATAHFTPEGIAPDGAIAGQYTAVIRCNAFASTVAALKLNAGTAAAPAWVSSSAFEVGMAPAITMTAGTSSPLFTVNGSTVTINWGDGTVPETVTTTPIQHTYTDGAPTHSIAIYGQNISRLVCNNMALSSLDVSNSTYLSSLVCTGNRLTSLDVSNNTRLQSLSIKSNLFTAAGLNVLFGTLPENPYASGDAGRLPVYIYNNPGTDGCTYGIASSRGWKVDATTKE